MCAWNAAQLEQMCLPPCHVLAQFFVDGKYLSCAMYQRSADLALGVPFNVASYSLLTCLIANHCGLVAREFVHFLGDTHVYNNHIEGLREQVERKPKPFPHIAFKPGVEHKPLEAIVFDDILLPDYECHGPIKMQLNTGLNQDAQTKKAKTEIISQ
jgi:thymidylate synthase